MSDAATSAYRVEHPGSMRVLEALYYPSRLLTTGRLSLPMREPERSFLLDVRCHDRNTSTRGDSGVQVARRGLHDR